MSSQVGFVGAGKKAVHVKVRFARVCTRSRDSASLGCFDYSGLGTICQWNDGIVEGYKGNIRYYCLGWYLKVILLVSRNFSKAPLTFCDGRSLFHFDN